MDSGNNENSWINESPLLAALDIKNPFSVPFNYFAESKDRINGLCMVENARFNLEEEFSIPVSYFEDLTAQIETRISEDNLHLLAAQHGFKVKQNYFTELESKIINRTELDKVLNKATVVSLKNNWFKYAAAAALVAIVFGSVLFFNNQNRSISSQLNKITDQDIVSYLQINSGIGDTPVIFENINLSINLSDFSSEFSDVELENYINTTL
ncbi:MAG: hypothetical protein H7096_00130 [Flavobacterium sp.]|nr:hypothetical protein [Pedobacter sp.]